MAMQHQEIQKQQQKAWHDRNIKNKNLEYQKKWLGWENPCSIMGVQNNI